MQKTGRLTLLQSPLGVMMANYATARQLRPSSTVVLRSTRAPFSSSSHSHPQTTATTKPSSTASNDPNKEQQKIAKPCWSCGIFVPANEILCPARACQRVQPIDPRVTYFDILYEYACYHHHHHHRQG
jgi:hypothetical protein